MYDLLTWRRMSPEEREKAIQQEEEERRQEEEQRERIRQQELEQWQRQYEARRLLYDNPKVFLETDGLYCYDPDGSISSQELYQIYRSWCIAKHIPIESPRTFWVRMREYGPTHALTYSMVIGSNGKRCRGFRGIRALTEITDTTHP